MPKMIHNIEVGTHLDDKRFTVPMVYIKAAEDRREIRSLTPEQALEFASAILDATRKALLNPVENTE